MSCVPDELKTEIITENDELIALKWLKASESFLANEHLPIWTTMQVGDVVERNYEVMKELGKFTTYYDLEKSSAIVLLEEWNCIHHVITVTSKIFSLQGLKTRDSELQNPFFGNSIRPFFTEIQPFGIIDVRYDIICLPLDQLRDYQHKVDESQYVRVITPYYFPDHMTPQDDLSDGTSSASPNQVLRDSDKTTNDFNMLIKTWVNSDFPLMSQDVKSPHSHLSESDKVMNSPSISCHEGSSRHKCPRVDYEERVIVVYPEILIVIPYEIVQTTEKLTTLVLRYLVQYNAVAMLFAKLASQNIKIHINIAGMIIEKSKDQFPSSLLFESSDNNGKAILMAVTNYLNSVRAIESIHQTLFVPDSFDFFILPTTYNWKDNELDPKGKSSKIHNLQIARKNKNPQLSNIRLGSIVKHINMKHYINVAREIAHLMTVQDDDLLLMIKNLRNNNKQTHGIMQMFCNNYCPTCLTWSEKSIQSFKEYLSLNDNRCFLRNLPRSLHHPYNSPMKTLYPADQCYCFGHLPDE
ncbi:hypothetical protein PV326_006160, partial [Microctonus aethiopoides]